MANHKHRKVVIYCHSNQQVSVSRLILKVGGFSIRDRNQAADVSTQDLVFLFNPYNFIALLCR
jgi:hypothetical protein